MERSFFQSARFAVISCTERRRCGLLFCRKSNTWSIEKSICSGAENSAGDQGKALKELLRELGCSGKEKIYISGLLPGSCFIRRASVALPVREQQSSIELALPELLPVPMEESRIQFFERAKEESSEVDLQVSVYPGAELEKFCAAIAENSVKADDFINPLLLLKPDDPLFFLDDLQPGFAFQNGCWLDAPSAAEKEAALRQWENIFRSLTTVPENFNVADFLILLPLARMELEHHPLGSYASLRMLPEKLRPLRYRHQLEMTGILVFLLIISCMWGTLREWSRQYSRYSEIMEQCQSSRSRISAINAKLKRNLKQEREMSRVVGLQAGEDQFLVKLAALSRILPDNVQLVNLRMSEGAWDLMFQSESAALNLPALINPLGYWKIAQLQQRQMWNSDVTTINLRLVPNEIQEKKQAAKNGAKTGKNRK